MPSTDPDARFDKVLGAIGAVQDAFVSAITSVVDSAKPIAEKLPAAPFADQLPDPVELAQTVYGLVQKVLDNQREFTIKVLDAYRPAPTAPKSTVKATAKVA